MAAVTTPKEAALFNNPIFSDIKIRQIRDGNVVEYFGHKVILCSYPAWFRNALMGGFKEASESVLEMHDDDPKHFRAMLKYLYAWKYEQPANNSELIKRFLYPIRLYLLADKYAIEGLTKDAVANMGCFSSCTSGYGCQVTPGEAHMETVIRATYGSGMVVGSALGLKISWYFPRHQKVFLKDAIFVSLVKEFPALGADTFLAGIKVGLMDTKGKGYR